MKITLLFHEIKMKSKANVYVRKIVIIFLIQIAVDAFSSLKQFYLKSVDILIVGHLYQVKILSLHFLPKFRYISVYLYKQGFSNFIATRST